MVVKIMIPFWVPKILGAVLDYNTDPKRDHNFDNHPYTKGKTIHPEKGDLNFPQRESPNADQMQRLEWHDWPIGTTAMHLASFAHEYHTYTLPEHVQVSNNAACNSQSERSALVDTSRTINHPLMNCNDDGY